MWQLSFMIQVKEAVDKAVEFATSLLGSDRAGQLQLEEVELSKHNGRDALAITLSMRPLLVFDVPSLSGGRREFFGDIETGHLTSMKIRHLTHADEFLERLLPQFATLLATPPSHGGK